MAGQKFFSIFRDWAEYICIARFTILAGSNNAASIFVAQLAGYWIRLLTGIKRIVQVHDQMMKAGMVPHTRDEKLNAYIEGRICSHTDLAWWFTDGALAGAKSRHPELGNRGVVTCWVLLNLR